MAWIRFALLALWNPTHAVGSLSEIYIADCGCFQMLLRVSPLLTASLSLEQMPAILTTSAMAVWTAPTIQQSELLSIPTSLKWIPAMTDPAQVTALLSLSAFLLLHHRSSAEQNVSEVSQIVIIFHCGSEGSFLSSFFSSHFQSLVSLRARISLTHLVLWFCCKTWEEKVDVFESKAVWSIVKLWAVMLVEKIWEAICGGVMLCSNQIVASSDLSFYVDCGCENDVYWYVCPLL